MGTGILAEGDCVHAPGYVTQDLSGAKPPNAYEDLSPMRAVEDFGMPPSPLPRG